jgi:hypothetical protein
MSSYGVAFQHRSFELLSCWLTCLPPLYTSSLQVQVQASTTPSWGEANHKGEVRITNILCENWRPNLAHIQCWRNGQECPHWTSEYKIHKLIVSDVNNAQGKEKTHNLTGILLCVQTVKVNNIQPVIRSRGQQISQVTLCSWNWHD